RRPHLDAVQRVLGDLNLLVETRDLATHVGEVAAGVVAPLLRGLKDLLAHLRDGLGEAGDLARKAAGLAFEPGPIALNPAQLVEGVIAAIRGGGDDADLLHGAGELLARTGEPALPRGDVLARLTDAGVEPRRLQFERAAVLVEDAPLIGQRD